MLICSSRTSCFVRILRYNPFFHSNKQLQDEIAPVRSRLRSKESEKNKLRSLGAEEEERLNNVVNTFMGSVMELKSVMTEIEEYAARNKSDGLEEQKRKSDELKDKISDKQRHIEKLQPAIEDLAKSIEDQERHRKNLKENIDLINSRKKIEELEKTIGKLEEEVSNVKGHDTCYDDMEGLSRRKQSVDTETAELQGRRREIMGHVRSIEVCDILVCFYCFPWKGDCDLFLALRKKI